MFFEVAENQSTDMTHIGTLGDAWNSLTFDESNNIYTVSDTILRKYDYDTYEAIEGNPINGNGRFVFYKNGHLIVVTEGGNYPTKSSIQFIDMQVPISGSISGFNINDTNGNGKWDAGEAGIQGWNITLKNVATGEIIASNLTDTNGFYKFVNLVNGSYNVTEEIGTGFTPTNATFKLVNVAGQNVMNLNFTNQPLRFNLIKNPGFESGTSPWLFYTNGTGKFTATPPGYEGSKSAKIVLYTGGTNIQLYQKGISLEPKTRYRLSFAANSTKGHDLKVASN